MKSYKAVFDEEAHQDIFKKNQERWLILNLKSNMVMEETGVSCEALSNHSVHPVIYIKNELFVLLVFVVYCRFLGKVSLKC